MKRHIEGCDCHQSFLLPACVDDYVDESNPVRAIKALVNALEFAKLGFGRANPCHGAGVREMPLFDAGHPHVPGASRG